MPEIKCKQCGCALYPLDGVTVVQCSHCATVNTVEQNPDRAPFIFTSYAHKDSAIVLPIIKAMKDDGFRIWHDNGVEVGTEWPAYIERMLRGCSVFIIFLSDHSVDSVNCRKEVNFAINNLGKKVLVMQMAEQIDYKEYGMEFQLDSYQKLFVCRHADLQSLLSALREANILQTCKDTAAKPVPTETAIPTATAQSDTARVKALVKRAFLFLEDGEREKADAYCEQALDLDPEYAPAYVVKTMLALGYTDIRDFENKCTEKLATHPAFSKALRFADDLYRTTLRHMEQQSNYNRAIALMQKGDMMSLCEAIVEFQSLEDAYADAADLRAQCQQKLDALTEEAKQRAEQENAEKPAVCVEVADDEDETADEYIALEPVPDKKDADGLYRVNVPFGENTQATAVQTASGYSLTDIRRRFSKNQGIIACGTFHTVGLKADGTAVTTDELDKFEKHSWSNLTAVSCGLWHTVGLKSDGTAVATGENRKGQCNVQNWTDIVAVACGDYHTVGLKSDGTAVATGKNRKGQCNVQNWTDIIAVACGEYHTVGLKADGTAVATGESRKSWNNVQNWTDLVAVACSDYHTVGLKSDGTAVATGENFDGECDVKKWTDIVAVACGHRHTVGLKADGTVVAVGNNEKGQCYVEGWTDIVAVACGDYHTVGLKADGTVVAVGDNQFGRCNVSGWKLF